MEELTGESNWKWPAIFHNCCGCCALYNWLLYGMRAALGKSPWFPISGASVGGTSGLGPDDWPTAALEFPHHPRPRSQAKDLGSASSRGCQGRGLLMSSQDCNWGAAPQLREWKGIQDEGNLLAPFRRLGGGPNDQQPGQGGQQAT